MSKIVKLEVSNFKRINVVDIEAGGSSVVIGGRNAQGKSSVLDAIDALLRGGKAFPDVPVKTGAKKAIMRCVLDDGMAIERSVTDSGTATLKITTADGMSPKSPQAWLDARLSAATCDPLAFLRAKPQDQAAELRRLVGVDTSALDEERRQVYERRTADGRQAKESAAVLASMAEPPAGTPETPVSSADIAAELEAAIAAQAKRDSFRAQAKDFRSEAEDLSEEADTREVKAAEMAAAMTAKAAELRAQAAELDQRAAQSKSDVAAEAEKLRTHAADEFLEAAALLAAADAVTIPDAAEIRQRLAGVDAINAQVRAAQRRTEASARAEEWQAKVQAATERLDAIDTERGAILAAASWPVAGLGIVDGVVTFRDVPLTQASQSEQLQIGLALALAGKPEIPVALIRDGSHLDDDALAMLAAHAEAAGAQVWIERVGSHDAGAVVIEDGRVVPAGAGKLL
jgi:hypothetical protein